MRVDIQIYLEAFQNKISLDRSFCFFFFFVFPCSETGEIIPKRFEQIIVKLEPAAER